MNTKTAELRKLAQEKGVVGWETMKRKDLENALSEPISNKGEDVIPNESFETTIEVEKKESDKGGIREEVAPVGSKAEKMKIFLASQPKIRVIVPLSDGEKKGSTQSVILNGYRLNILKGVYVDVPIQVAEVLNESNSVKLELSDHELRIHNDNK